jgi:gluconokinase
MVIVVMGVAGSGKTTIGELLARRLGWPFHDADDLHSVANRDKMRRGIALIDIDRRPWLAAMRGLIEEYVVKRADAVIACSALKQLYREAIITDPEVVRLVYLKGAYDLIAARLASRQTHFFDPHLLRNQFETLEEPTDAIVEDVARDPLPIVDSILMRLALKPRRPETTSPRRTS